MEKKFRCDCPFTSALDVIGDKWMLVIVKLMLVEGKETFKDFTESSEAIATNILSVKLKLLEEWGVLRKTKLPYNTKTNIYLLTERVIELTPVLVAMAQWSDQNLRGLHPSLQNDEGVEKLRADKEAFTNAIETAYREKLQNIEKIVR